MAKQAGERNYFCALPVSQAACAECTPVSRTSLQTAAHIVFFVNQFVFVYVFVFVFALVFVFVFVSMNPPANVCSFSDDHTCHSFPPSLVAHTCGPPHSVLLQPLWICKTHRGCKKDCICLRRLGFFLLWPVSLVWFWFIISMGRLNISASCLIHHSGVLYIFCYPSLILDYSSPLRLDI